MYTYPAKARTATDGTLRLAIPTGLPDAEMDVLVVFDMVPASTAKSADFAAGWPPGYFEEFFGALRDENLVRHAQGDFEERQPLS
jgi:hypothetical protein